MVGVGMPTPDPLTGTLCPYFLLNIMDTKFIEFCQRYLSDAGVYDTFNQRFLLKKTQNYHHAWQRAQDPLIRQLPKQMFVDTVLQEVNDTYEIGDKMVTIDRRRHYELIYEHWNK